MWGPHGGDGYRLRSSETWHRVVWCQNSLRSQKRVFLTRLRVSRRRNRQCPEVTTHSSHKLQLREQAPRSARNCRLLTSIGLFTGLRIDVLVTVMYYTAWNVGLGDSGLWAAVTHLQQPWLLYVPTTSVYKQDNVLQRNMEARSCNHCCRGKAVLHMWMSICGLSYQAREAHERC